MENRTIRIVVSCSSRKKLNAPDDLKINNYQGNLEQKIKEWDKRLSTPATQQYPAVDMYQGGHWSIARKIHGFVSNENSNIELWIASAGYGLIRADTLIESYAATFSRGFSDSVNGDSKTLWWDLLSSRQRLSPSNLTALVENNPDDFLVVALSDTYLKALEKDLLGVTNLLTREKFLLISASVGKEQSDLSCFHVSADARLVNKLGGNLISLNARVVLHLLEKESLHKWKRNKIDKYFYELTESQLPFKRLKRKKLTDEQIVSFITQQINETAGQKKESVLSHTQLLRRLRDAGHACEQTRFRKIFEETMLSRS